MVCWLMDLLRAKKKETKEWTEMISAIQQRKPVEAQVLTERKKSTQECLALLSEAAAQSRCFLPGPSAKRMLLNQLDRVANQRQLRVDQTGGNVRRFGTDCFSILVGINPATGRPDTVAFEYNNDKPSIACPELLADLLIGNFDSLLKHIDGLNAVYNVRGDRMQRHHAYLCLQALEEDLSKLSQAVLPSPLPPPPDQLASAPLPTRVRYSLVGLLRPRSGGVPGRLIYLMPPSEKVYAACVSLQGCPEDNLLPYIPLVNMQKDATGYSSPMFTKQDKLKCTQLAARFVLTLDPPLVMEVSRIKKLESITHISVMSKLPPENLIKLFVQTSKQLYIDGAHFFVTVPTGQHAYQVKCPLRGCLVEEIPFTCPSQLLDLVALLREQAAFNAFLESFLRVEISTEKDLDLVSLYRVHIPNVSEVKVSFDHPTVLTASLQLDVRLGTFGVTCASLSSRGAPVKHNPDPVMRSCQSLSLALAWLETKMAAASVLPMDTDPVARTAGNKGGIGSWHLAKESVIFQNSRDILGAGPPPFNLDPPPPRMKPTILPPTLPPGVMATSMQSRDPHNRMMALRLDELLSTDAVPPPPMTPTPMTSSQYSVQTSMTSTSFATPTTGAGGPPSVSGQRSGRVDADGQSVLVSLLNEDTPASVPGPIYPDSYHLASTPNSNMRGQLAQHLAAPISPLGPNLMSVGMPRVPMPPGVMATSAPSGMLPSNHQEPPKKPRKRRAPSGNMGPAKRGRPPSSISHSISVPSADIVPPPSAGFERSELTHSLSFESSGSLSRQSSIESVMLPPPPPKRQPSLGESASPGGPQLGQLSGRSVYDFEDTPSLPQLKKTPLKMTIKTDKMQGASSEGSSPTSGHFVKKKSVGQVTGKPASYIRQGEAAGDLQKKRKRRTKREMEEARALMMKEKMDKKKPGRKRKEGSAENSMEARSSTPTSAESSVSSSYHKAPPIKISLNAVSKVEIKTVNKPIAELSSPGQKYTLSPKSKDRGKSRPSLPLGMTLPGTTSTGSSLIKGYKIPKKKSVVSSEADMTASSTATPLSTGTEVMGSATVTAQSTPPTSNTSTAVTTGGEMRSSLTPEGSDSNSSRHRQPGLLPTPPRARPLSPDTAQAGALPKTSKLRKDSISAIADKLLAKSGASWEGGTSAPPEVTPEARPASAGPTPVSDNGRAQGQSGDNIFEKFGSSGEKSSSYPASKSEKEANDALKETITASYRVIKSVKDTPDSPTEEPVLPPSSGHKVIPVSPPQTAYVEQPPPPMPTPSVRPMPPHAVLQRMHHMQHRGGGYRPMNSQEGRPLFAMASTPGRAEWATDSLGGRDRTGAHSDIPILDQGSSPPSILVNTSRNRYAGQTTYSRDYGNQRQLPDEEDDLMDEALCESLG